MSFRDVALIETIASGVVVASAFVIGSLIAVYFSYSRGKRSLFAAFGAGIFLATIMILIQHSLDLGNIFDLIIGFSLGAVSFGLAEHYIKHGGSKNNNQNRAKSSSKGRLSIIGTVLDSFPETIFIGIIVGLQEPGLFTTETVLFLGNLATTLEAAKIMQKQGISKKKIIRDWTFDFIIVAAAAPIGYFLARNVVEDFLSIILSFAAGALIVFIAGELISRAYRESVGHNEDFVLSLGFIIGIILLFVI